MKVVKVEGTVYCRYGTLVNAYYNTICSKQIYAVDFFNGDRAVVFENEFEEVSESEATLALVMQS